MVLKYVKFFSLLIFCFLLWPLPSHAKDHFRENDPSIGQTVSMPAHLLVITGLTQEGIPKGLASEKFSATTLELMQNCAGCPNDKIKLEYIFPPNTRLTIRKVFLDDTSWYEVDSSPIEWYVLQADNGLTLIMPAFNFDENLMGHDIEFQEKLIESFERPDQEKSFYVQNYPFNIQLTRSTVYPSCPDFNHLFAPVLKALKDYVVNDIRPDPHACAINVKANQKALAYILMRKNDWQLSISPSN